MPVICELVLESKQNQNNSVSQELLIHNWKQLKCSSNKMHSKTNHYFFSLIISLFTSLWAQLRLHSELSSLEIQWLFLFKLNQLRVKDQREREEESSVKPCNYGIATDSAQLTNSLTDKPFCTSIDRLNVISGESHTL